MTITQSAPDQDPKMTVVDFQTRLSAQRKRDPPASRFVSDVEESKLHLSGIGSTHDDRVSQKSSRVFNASSELDAEIALVGTNFGVKEGIQCADESILTANETAGCFAVGDDTSSHYVEEMKILEELKVVRHLTRPIQADIVSIISERSRISKRKPRRKRGKSLERDISRTILQTADAEATEALFLLESLKLGETGEKGANYILSDLDQQNSDILAIDEVVNKSPYVNQPPPTRTDSCEGLEMESSPNEEIKIVSKADPPEVLPGTSENYIGKGIDKANHELHQSETDQIDGEDKDLSKFISHCDGDKTDDEPPRKSTALQRRLASTAESRQSGIIYTFATRNDDSLQGSFLHPDPSLQDITFSSNSVSSEEEKVDDFEFFEENKFGNMDDFDDDQWTSFGNSPFSISDKHNSMARSQEMEMAQHGTNDPPACRRSSSVQSRKPSRGMDQFNPSKFVMQPRSPASVRDFRSNPGGGKFESTYNSSLGKWNLDLPGNEKGQS